MKKKKVRFDEIKAGECFKYRGIVYRKYSAYGENVAQLTGKTRSPKFFWNDDNVIPVTVTIKVEEKK